MAYRSQHQVLGLEGQALGGHILVQGQDPGRLSFEARDLHAPDMNDPVRVLHSQLDCSLGLPVIAALGPGRRVDLRWRLARHVGSLELVDGLDLGVGIYDPSGSVLEHHAHRRVAEDRLHHPALTVELVDQLELPDQHRGLAGEHTREPARL